MGNSLEVDTKNETLKLLELKVWVTPITLSLLEKTINKELPKFLRIGLPIVLLLVGMGFVSVEKKDNSIVYHNM